VWVSAQRQSDCPGGRAVSGGGAGGGGGGEGVAGGHNFFTQNGNKSNPNRPNIPLTVLAHVKILI